MRGLVALSLALSLGAACGPAAQPDPGGDDDGGGGTVDAGGPGGADAPPWTPPPAQAKVYAHSADELYTVDPDTLQVALVGPFAWDRGSDQMTDIAIDGVGNMVGISFGSVYAVDKATAGCTYLADLDRSFNGMSFVPAQEIDGTGAEVLVAAALDGAFYRLEPTTGQSTPVGNYGNSMGSSGDIVSVAGFGTVATVTRPGQANDWLVRVNPNSGAATPIGDTGYAGIWGLGFWKSKVYGFTDSNQFVLIDVNTGAATPVETGSVSWWGAGVTTAAPVIP